MDCYQPWTCHNTNGNSTEIQAGVLVIFQKCSSPKCITPCNQEAYGYGQIAPTKSPGALILLQKKENIERVKSMVKTDPTVSLSANATSLVFGLDK